jgi:hypothetical protein
MWTAWLERTLTRRRIEPARAADPARRCAAAAPDRRQDEALPEHHDCGQALEPVEP